jgi:hypothetical protein
MVGIATGIGLTSGIMALGVAGSLGLGAYEASQAHGIAESQLGMQQTTFAEQQGFEKQLADLIANPSSITSQPGYQFQFDQGLQALMRSQAAGGFYGSGNMGTALTQYGQQFAMSDLSQQEQLLASLSGLAPASPAQYGSNAIAGQNANFSQLGALLGGLGYLARTGTYSPGSPAANAGGIAPTPGYAATPNNFGGP